MPKVSDAHRESRRAQIVDAALRCFAEKGFQRTSMADIIEASGLSAGAIYLHFESKQQIAVAAARMVVGHRQDDLVQRLRQEPLPDPDELIGVVMAGLRAELPDSRLLVQLWGEGVVDPAIGEIVLEIMEQLRGIFVPYLTSWAAQRRGAGPAEAAAWAETTLPALLGLAQGFIVQSAIFPAFRPDAYLAAVRSLFS
jgi:AcrR family transcriptional regulator